MPYTFRTAEGTHPLTKSPYHVLHYTPRPLWSDDDREAWTAAGILADMSGQVDQMPFAPSANFQLIHEAMMTTGQPPQGLSQRSARNSKPLTAICTAQLTPEQLDKLNVSKTPTHMPVSARGKVETVLTQGDRSMSYTDVQEFWAPAEVFSSLPDGSFVFYRGDLNFTVCATSFAQAPANFTGLGAYLKKFPIATEGVEDRVFKIKLDFRDAHGEPVQASDQISVRMTGDAHYKHLPPDMVQSDTQVTTFENLRGRFSDFKEDTAADRRPYDVTNGGMPFHRHGDGDLQSEILTFGVSSADSGGGHELRIGTGTELTVFGSDGSEIRTFERNKRTGGQNMAVLLMAKLPDWLSANTDEKR